MNYHFVPIELKEANRFIAQFHRHNKPVVGAKFQIGLMKEEELIGVGICWQTHRQNVIQWENR